MITIAGITKRFTARAADRLAVDDLSFDVATGRVTGFVGPNGAGKSTTCGSWSDSPDPIGARCGTTASNTSTCAIRLEWSVTTSSSSVAAGCSQPTRPPTPTPKPDTQDTPTMHAPPAPLRPSSTARSITTASRTRRDGLAALSGLLRSEAIKFASLRSNRVLVAAAFLGGLLTSWLVATLVTDEVLAVADVGFYWTVVSAMFAAVTGVALFTSELQHGTLSAILTAHPRRGLLVMSKTIVAIAAGIVLGAAGVTGGFAGALPTDIGIGDGGRIPLTIVWALCYTALSAVLGLGVGLIVRHGAGAISGLFIWGFVVENLLIAFVPATVVRFLPFYAGTQLLAIDSDLDSPEILAAALTRPQSALVFAAYAVLAWSLGVAALHRRDID